MPVKGKKKKKTLFKKKMHNSEMSVFKKFKKNKLKGFLIKSFHVFKTNEKNLGKLNLLSAFGLTMYIKCGKAPRLDMFIYCILILSFIFCINYNCICLFFFPLGLS